MPKRLVLCCDGTWNTADQQRSGRSCPTNVTKVALGIADEDTAGNARPLSAFTGVQVAETNLAGTILSRAVGMPIARYASLKVWRPFGMEADAYWQVDERGSPGDARRPRCDTGVAGARPLGLADGPGPGRGDLGAVAPTRGAAAHRRGGSLPGRLRLRGAGAGR